MQSDEKKTDAAGLAAEVVRYLSAQGNRLLYTSSIAGARIFTRILFILVLIFTAISIMPFLGMTLGFGFAEWFGLPVWLGFLIATGILLLFLLLAFAFRGKIQAVWRNAIAKSLLEIIDELKEKNASKRMEGNKARSRNSATNAAMPTMADTAKTDKP